MSKLSLPNGHYSHYTQGGGLTFISGQLPLEPGPEVPATLEEQVELVFKKLDAILTDAGLERRNILQCRIYITDVNYWNEVNELYALYFGSHKPARCIVPVPELHFGCKIELEAVASMDHV